MAEPQSVFSEKEVSEIMQRAAELQEKSPASYTRGITRDELLRIAEEIGVEPQVLSQAIDEQLASKGKKPFQLIREEERVVDGEIDPSDFDLILNNFKAMQTLRGAPVQIGKTLRARVFAGGSIQRVEITSRKGRTRISVKHFPFLPIFGTLYPALIGTVLSSGPLAGHGFAGAAVAAATGLFAAAIGAMGIWMSRGNRGTKALADRLQRSIADELAAPEASATSAPASEQLQQRIGH